MSDIQTLNKYKKDIEKTKSNKARDEGKLEGLVDRLKKEVKTTPEKVESLISKKKKHLKEVNKKIRDGVVYLEDNYEF